MQQYLFLDVVGAISYLGSVAYQFRVVLQETDPPIWRRFVVPSSITLHRLHLILQEVMGWTNSHLYRFKIDTKEYAEPDPVEANVVKSLFNDFLNGKGLIDIVRDLNAKGIPGPKGKGWGKNGVYKILNNEIHTGTFVWGRNSKRGLAPVRAENACPAIVNKKTFLQLQEILKERAPIRMRPRRTASPFLLSGIVYCGYCGKALVGRYAKSGEFSYYVCGTLDKKGAGSCPACYLRTEWFEAIVIEQTKKHVLTRENLIELVNLTNQELDSNMKSHHAELDAISRSESDTNQRLGRLYDAIETGKVDLDDLVVRIRELRQRQEQLQSRRIEIENQISDRKVELIDLKTMTEL